MNSLKIEPNVLFCWQNHTNYLENLGKPWRVLICTEICFDRNSHRDSFLFCGWVYILIFGYNVHIKNMGKACFGTLFEFVWETFGFLNKILWVSRKIWILLLFLKKNDQKGNLLKVRFNVFCIVQGACLIKYQICLA